MKKKLLSFILAFVMVISLLPTAALAKGSGPWNGEKPDNFNPDSNFNYKPAAGQDTSIIADIKQGEPDDSVEAGAYNKIKVRLEDTDCNSLTLKTGYPTSVTFDKTSIGPDDIAAQMEDYIPDGYYYVGTFFYWHGQPAKDEDYQTGNPKYVENFVNKGQISKNYSWYNSYLGFTTIDSGSADDWGDKSDLYAYNPTGTLHLVYAKLSDVVNNVWVKLNCSTVGDHTKNFNLLPGSFTLGEVNSNSSGRTRTLTINPGKYIEEFNKTYPGHELVSPESSTITLQYDSTSKVWKPASDDSIPVEFTVKCAQTYTYTLSYDANAGDDEVTGMPSAQTESDTAETSHQFTIATDRPARNGYTFLGWAEYERADTAMTATTVTLTSTNPTKTLYAVWKQNVTVTFDANEGAWADDAADTKYTIAEDRKTASATGEKGKLTLTEIGVAPQRASYTFAGWYASKEDAEALNNQVAFVGMFVTSTQTTLYAGWKKNAPETAGYTLRKHFIGADGQEVLGIDSLTSSGTAAVGTPIATLVAAATGFTVNQTYNYQTYIYVAADTKVNSAALDGQTLCDGDVIHFYYYLDAWKDDPNGDSKTGGDNIPDCNQILVEYVAYHEEGTTSPEFEVITLDGDTNPTASGSTATPAKGYAFDYWTDIDGTTKLSDGAALAEKEISSAQGGETYTFTAYFAIDVVGGMDEDGNDTGDNIPDKYQKKVTYKIVNGEWVFGTEPNITTSDADIIEYVTLVDDNNKWDVNGSGKLTKTPTNMVSDANCTGGAWDVVLPETVTGTDPVTYTFSYIPIGATTFDPDSVTFEGQDGKHTGIFFKKLTGNLPSNFSEEFQITLTRLDVVQSRDGVEYSPSNETYTGTVIMKAAGTAAFQFAPINFTQEGLYVYTVKETKGDTSYITYDEKTYTLFVQVGYPVIAQSVAEVEHEEVAQLEVLNWYIMPGEVQQQVTFTNTSNYVYYPPHPPVKPEPTIKVKGLDTINHLNYIIGIGDDLVNPLGTITRAEVATIYFRLMTDEWRGLYWSDSNSYYDVNASAWYNVAVSTLEKAGIIKDTVAGGAFRPDDPITRAELSVMAAQFCTVTGSIPKTAFKDVPVTHWAYNEITLIEYAGWIEGDELRYFRPDDDLTRAECVTIVNRMLNRGAEPENMLDNMVVFADNLNVNTWYFAAIQEAANTHTYTRTDRILTGEHFRGEKWTALLPATDWAALEKAWTQAYKVR